MARKLILNGGAIRPTCLLLLITITRHNYKANYINVSVLLILEPCAGLKVWPATATPRTSLIPWLIDGFWAYIRVLIIISIRGKFNQTQVWYREDGCNIKTTQQHYHYWPCHPLCERVNAWHVPGSPKWRPPPWKYAHGRVFSFYFCFFWPPKPVIPPWALLRGLPVLILAKFIILPISPNKFSPIIYRFTVCHHWQVMR